MIIKLRNKHTAPIVSSVAADRTDGAIVPINNIVQPGKTGDFDGDNPGVKVYVRGGLLTPTDSKSKTWSEGL